MSCKSQSPDDAEVPQPSVPAGEVYLEYLASGTAYHEGDARMTMCLLTGTGETLVLGKLVSDPVYHGRDPDCSVREPFRDAYWEMEFESLRTAGRDEVGDVFTTIALLGFNPELVYAKKGDHMLVSMRVADGTPFLIRYQNVELRSSSSEPTTTATDLPATWSALVTQAEDVQQNHAAKCLELVDQGPGGCRDMSDDEFDTWIHDPIPKTCSQPVRQPDAPDFGVVVDDTPD